MSETPTTSALTETPETALRLRDFLPYRLSVLSNTISTAIADTYGDRFGLTIWQWRCMAVIGETPGLAARDVAARTAMDKVAVSRAVSGLEALGLIRRETDAADRRTNRLSLTASGRRIYDEIVPLALDYEARLISDLTPEELSQLQSIMAKLAQSARENGPPLW